MQQSRNMKVRLARDKMEAVKLPETINKREDVRKFDISKLNEALVSGTSIIVAIRKLGAGENQMYAIRKPNGDFTYNRSKVTKVVYGEFL